MKQLFFPVTNEEVAPVPAGTPVYLSSPEGMRKAVNTSLNESKVAGLLLRDVLVGGRVRVAGFGHLTLTTAQWDIVTGGSGGLVPNAWYFLDSVSGKMTLTAPTVAGFVVQLGQAISETRFLLQIDRKMRYDTSYRCYVAED